MLYGALGYAKRAAECARLANLTADPMIRKELLLLRQTYLRVAETFGMPMHEAISTTVEAPQSDEGATGPSPVK